MTPTMWLGALALLAALAIAMLFRRRRVPPARRVTPAHDEPADIETAAQIPRPATPATPATPARAQAEAVEVASPEIGAAFYDEVVTLLETELARNPQREDLRVKLLEVYAATERRPEFIKLATRHLQSPGVSEASRIQVIEMGRSLVPEHAFADPVPAAAPATAPAAPRPPAPTFRRYYESVDAHLLKARQDELQLAWQTLRQEMKFWKGLRELSAEFVRAPSPLLHAKRLSSFVGGAQILVKNETKRPAGDTAMVSALGQVLAAQMLGRWRVVAAPADEGHLLAVAHAAVKLNLEAEIVVLESERAPRARELASVEEVGAKLVYVLDGTSSGGNEGQRRALMRALEHGAGTLFISPLSAGPPPYPTIVREMQQLGGLELKSQISGVIGRAPDGLILSAMDGMHSIGLLQAFLATPAVKLFCVEAGPEGGSRKHKLSREHGWLRASGRVRYTSVPEEVARFAAEHCLPDRSGPLGLAGGEVLVEAFTLARQFSAREVVVVVLPSDTP